MWSLRKGTRERRDRDQRNELEGTQQMGENSPERTESPFQGIISRSITTMRSIMHRAGDLNHDELASPITKDICNKVGPEQVQCGTLDHSEEPPNIMAEEIEETDMLENSKGFLDLESSKQEPEGIEKNLMKKGKSKKNNIEKEDERQPLITGFVTENTIAESPHQSKGGRPGQGKRKRGKNTTPHEVKSRREQRGINRCRRREERHLEQSKHRAMEGELQNQDGNQKKYGDETNKEDTACANEMSSEGSPVEGDKEETDSVSSKEEDEIGIPINTSVHQ